MGYNANIYEISKMIGLFSPFPASESRNAANGAVTICQITLHGLCPLERARIPVEAKFAKHQRRQK